MKLILKWNLKKYINIFFVSSLFIINLTANENVTKYAKIKLFVHDKHELEEILKQGIAVEHFKGKMDQGIELIINHQELELLKQLNVNFEMLILDMGEYYANRSHPSEKEMDVGYNIQFNDNVTGYTLGSMGGFHTRDEHVAIQNYLHNTFPNIVSPLIQIGQTHEGINMYAIRISDNPTVQESGEGNVYFDGLIHAREPMSGEVLLYYLYWLVENYGTNPEATYLVNNRQIYLVTVVNPDGYLYNENIYSSTGSFGNWRKNRRNNGGSYGVDLNRNFGYQWGYDNTGSSPTPSSETYRGPSAFSEPETQAVRDFILLAQPSIGFNCHTYSGVFLNPYGYSGIPTAYEYYSEFAGDFAHNLNYPYGTSAEMIGYPSNGTARDWMHHDAQCFTWVPEIGESGFWPSQSEIIPLNSKFLPVLKYLTWVSGNYVDYQKFRIAEGEAVPGDTISLIIEVKNKGLSLVASQVEINITSLNTLATPINSSAIIDSINFQQIKDNVNNPIKFLVDHSAGTIDELKFRIDITQENVLTSSDTISIFVGEQNVLFSDTADDGIVNWTVSGTGLQWDTTFVNYFSRWHSFSDSRYGSYSSNSSSYCSSINTINLAETENPRLEFAAKWTLEPNYDYIRIEISTNGGGMWSTLSGKYSVIVSGQPSYTNVRKGWIQESIDLGTYIGSQVNFRFRLISDGGLNTDGFYFDDFRIVDYKTPLVNTTADGKKIPSKFELKQNFPNPFNNSTKIKYNLPEPARVEVNIYNILGEAIKTFKYKLQDSGTHYINWDGRNISGNAAVSGIYFISICANSTGKQFKETKKCVLLK